MPSSSPPNELRVAWLIYRGNPHCGGQGVYTRYIAREVIELGHHVEVLSGQPWPELDHPETLVKVSGLDLYPSDNPFRVPWPWEFRDAVDLGEFARMCSGEFPEPWAFSLRARRILQERRADFDLVHDNQSFGTGLLKMIDDGWPMCATLHHPITVDRELELREAPNAWRRFNLHRWYAFLDMQMKVARAVPRLVTVSENSKRDIVAQMGVREDRLNIVPVGVDQEMFTPRPDVARVPGRLLVTTSSDQPLKGLVPLLEAVAKVRTERPDVHLVVIGRRKEGSKIPAVLDRLDLSDHVSFVSGVPTERIVELYAECELAVVPSLYEGFSLPAIEAMSCGAPLVTTTGGALPEVVGTDGACALTVPPNDPSALAVAITTMIDDPELRARLGAAGRARVLDRFTWKRTAQGMIENWYALLDEQSRVRVVLTVDFERLGLRPGERILDMGCGGGRHAFAAMKLGAEVVALDYSEGELKDVRATVGAMIQAGEMPSDQPWATINGDALRLPFPTDSFDRVVCSEVLEHIWDYRGAIAELTRVLRPGGRMAVTVPTRWPERVSWALDYHYHDTPGGHVRIFRQHELERDLETAGLWLRGSHHAHALHSPYWWIRCAGGVNDSDRPLAKRYHEFLVWQLTNNPRWLATVDRALNPVLGKSLVIYTQKVDA